MSETDVLGDPQADLDSDAAVFKVVFGEVYNRTTQKRLSDLALGEAHGVQVCQTKGMYHEAPPMEP